MKKERNFYKISLIAILLISIVIASMFIIAGKTKTEVIKSNITEIITPSYKLASTPYATLVYIGNGTAKIGGIAGMKYNDYKNINSTLLNPPIYFPYTNITIDNKTFAIANESITISNTITEIKQQIPLSAFASKNGTLYYIRLINFSKYYGVIIPANFMNKSNISLPFRITPYPSCPIIPAVSSPNDIVFNKGLDNNGPFGLFNQYTSNIYAYTGVIILKNTTGIVGNRQYPLCYYFIEHFKNSTIYSINNVVLNYTYFNFYNNLLNQVSIYPEIQNIQAFKVETNGTYIGIDLPEVIKPGLTRDAGWGDFLVGCVGKKTCIW